MKVLDEVSDRLERARALRGLGDVLDLTGQRGEAELVRDRAAGLTRSTTATKSSRSMPHPTRSLRRHRRSSGGGEQPVPDPPDADTRLTDAERRVSMMAAAGNSNREIADSLSITVSTVEQHLTRVYRKLRINRRRDLPGTFSVESTPTAVHPVPGGQPLIVPLPGTVSHPATAPALATRRASGPARKTMVGAIDPVHGQRTVHIGLPVEG